MSLLSFHRKKWLKSSKIISELFNSGDQLYKYPVRLLYRVHPTDQSEPVKAGFAVPSKKFRKAVQRNLLKRRMRESYRVNQHRLPGNSIQGAFSIDLFFVYASTTEENYESIEKAMRSLLSSLSQNLKKAARK